MSDQSWFHIFDLIGSLVSFMWHWVWVGFFFGIGFRFWWPDTRVVAEDEK